MISQLLNGVKTYVPKSRKELMEYVLEHKSILVAVNAEKIYHATEQTRSIINRNVGYADGVGAVWALKRKGHKNVAKIPGCELWLNLIENYHTTKSFYLVGGKEEIINKTVSRLKSEFPEIKIVGHRNGYLKNQTERQELIDDISVKKPDIVFVAMGSPKQELLMEEMYRVHPAVYQGLGGSFDVYTGNVKRAPEWWIKNNLEGIYRTLNEPKKRVMGDIRVMPYFFRLILNRL
ncbi:WecB/TagA/CpsF family glycosyltransferase [Maribacter chungangensis]|uniref:WecB/TagA/CpsF family glycosyltransferase n=1 Tax=Maribacter chungangensis TaxID=1069117 RepID=A0ABW3B2M4_9FLAO